MIFVYINYPTKRLSIHKDSSCRRIRQHNKSNQRRLQIDSNNSSKMLATFENNQHRFAAEPGLNDMWLEIDLANEAEELALVNTIRKMLSLAYAPFESASIKEHC